MKIKKAIRAVLYLRLSDEDKDKLTKEELSESIKNQETMLKDYAKEHNWEIVSVFKDEDWSGSDATRPEFNDMIKYCKDGNTDIVLCKSQSRFARDMELVEKYVHNLFHEWNIRFVTVVDRIDNTKQETKKTSQILGLTDQWYLEDTSENVRKTLKIKRENGQFTGSFAPYGYMKDSENKNHLIVDPIASNIVKRIYEEFLSGKGISTIAKDLNKDNILSPYEYKKINGIKLSVPLLKSTSNYEFIERAGTYKIDVYYTNNENQIINNLVTYNFLSSNKNKFDNKCEIILKQFSSKKMKVYYTTNNDIDINNFNLKQWTVLNENETIPNNTTCIATYTPKLDNMHTIEYHFEITLKENIKHEKFYFYIERKSKNKNVVLNFKYNIRNKYKWSEQYIKKILTNEYYIGNLVQFKSTTVSYKNHTIIHNDKEDWIKVYNTHTKIINSTDWYKVQERLKLKSRSTKKGTLHPFTNKVFCMKCNQPFCKCGKNNKCGYGYLACRDKRNKWLNCDNKKYLNEKDFYNFIINKINILLNKFYSEKDLKNLEKKDTVNNLYENKINGLEKELKKLEKELEYKISCFSKLYEDYTKEILTEKEFLILKLKYNDEVQKLESRISNIKQDINTTLKQKNSIKDKTEIIKKYKHIEKIDNEIINEFIYKILIGKYNIENQTREIKIIWNFII